MVWTPRSDTGGGKWAAYFRVIARRSTKAIAQQQADRPGGTLTVTLEGLSMSGQGILVVASPIAFGALDQTLGGIGLVTSGGIVLGGSASATLGQLSSVGAAKLRISGASNASLAAASLTSAAALRLSGSLSASLDALTLSGSGPLSSTAATLTSAAGAPPTVDLTFGADIYAGFFLRIQRTDTGTGSAGDYTSPTLDVRHFLTAAERAAEAIPNANLTGDGYSDPTGTWWQRYRWERDDGIVGPWSEVSGTVSASVAQWTAVNGVSKHADLTVSTVTVTGSSGVSSNTIRAVRCNTVAQNAKFHMEFEVMGLNTAASANGNILVGVIEGPSSPSLSSALAGQPGNSNYSGNGFSLAIRHPGLSTSISLYANNTFSASGITASFAVGDKIIMEVDTSGTNPVVNIWFYDASAGTTTQTHTNVTVSTKKPSTYYAFAACYRSGDSVKAHFGADAFQRTPTSGYDIYG